MLALKILTSLSYRWDATSRTCWYNSADTVIRFRWLIGTQTSWIIITVVGEVGAFLIILGYLITHEVRLSLPLPHPMCADCRATDPLATPCPH
jgi:hypothetical protein